MTEWDGILRCKTFNVWPERIAADLPPLDIDYGAASPIQVHTSIQSYAPRSSPELDLVEETIIGFELFDGEYPGLHRIWDAILVGVGDTVQLAPRNPRRARRGEIDIQLRFTLDDRPPDPVDPLLDALRLHAYEVLAVLNLRLRDFARPTMPFQIREILPNDEALVTHQFRVATEPRLTLDEAKIGDCVLDLAHFTSDADYAAKHRVALELYAAHFTEQQVRVRFILLVIAMEALAESTEKHPVAVALLNSWEKDLKTELAKYDESSDEAYDLEALARELDFRSGDSINNKVRKLFRDLPGVSTEECAELQRRAVRVYNKRSTLVHRGHVPVDELPDLEREARFLLERLLAGAIERSKLGGDRFGVRAAETPEKQKWLALVAEHAPDVPPDDAEAVLCGGSLSEGLVAQAKKLQQLQLMQQNPDGSYVPRLPTV